jgi:hypothetical protein
MTNFNPPFEFRACYLAIPLYICGFVTLGAALEKHLGVGALIMGWGIAEFSVMINTVAVYAYCNDSFPRHQVRLSLDLHLNLTIWKGSEC